MYSGTSSAHLRLSDLAKGPAHRNLGRRAVRKGIRLCRACQAEARYTGGRCGCHRQKDQLSRATRGKSDRFKKRSKAGRLRSQAPSERCLGGPASHSHESERKETTDVRETLQSLGYRRAACSNRIAHLALASGTDDRAGRGVLLDGQRLPLASGWRGGLGIAARTHLALVRFGARQPA
jgi:hypothetical protein